MRRQVPVFAVLAPVFSLALPTFAVAAPAFTVLINEIRIDQSGTDNDEYFELFGDPEASLEGVTYLVIGDDAEGSAGSGVIEAIVDLTGATIPASGYFVVAESSFTLGNPDLQAGLDFENSDNVTHLLVEGFSGEINEDLDIDDDGTLDVTPWGSIIDSVGLIETVGSGDHVYSETTVGPDGEFVPGHVLRCPDGGDWQIGGFSLGTDDTPGASNCSDEPPVATFIHEVQGSGLTSPLLGETVTIEAIVVGDFQGDGLGDNGNLNGFFVQEEDADADADTATSEGIFIYDPDGIADVRNGDLVRVTGAVGEYFDLTQIAADAVEVVATTSHLPTQVDVYLPVTSTDDLEAFEGMRVRFPQSLVISEYFNFDRFGEIVLAAPAYGEERLYTPTAIEAPGTPAMEDRTTYNRLARITLDDGRSSQNPDPARHPNGGDFTLDNRFRGGDLITNASGVLDYSFGLFRIQPTAGADYTAINPRPESPSAVGGTLEVAGFNVLNYFNGDGQGGGFPTSRGADDQEELERQSDKIVAAICALDADIVGLIEIENDGADGDLSALAELVDRLNAAASCADAGRSYARLATGVIGSDEIATAFIYDPGRVRTVGDFAILDASVDPRFIDTKNRPVLAQTFEELTTSEVLTVAVNHFKSKGSPCDDIGDPDLGDGQGNCNRTRTDAARALADWLTTDPTASGDPDALIIGDLNAYDKEDPIESLREAGYTDLLDEFEGELAYSYVFDGQFGHLDYALANMSLADHVTGATAWHSNADEPDILDYDTTFKQDAQDALHEPNAFRSSDHDAVLVGLALGDLPVPQCDGRDATIYVSADGLIVGGASDGFPYRGILAGTAGSDVIVGTSEDDRILGLAGDDLLCGGAGRDWVLGGAGDDTLFGEAGNDLIVGGFGPGDLADGGSGIDLCLAVSDKTDCP